MFFKDSNGKWLDFQKIVFHYFSNNRENKYLSQCIDNDDIDSWSCDNPIFISAQTGKGKNHFIQHNLIKKLHDDNVLYNEKEKILLLSNRVALNRQNKLALVKILYELGYEKPSKEIEYYTDQGIDKLFWDLDLIVVCSYHQFYENVELQNRHFKYVICDECHFFTSDSLFYPYSKEIINIITSKFGNAIRIYMSATLEETFLPIMYLEKKYNIPKDDDIECIYYYFQRNYDYIKSINVYENLTQLTEIIKESKDKWLIFVASKKEGKSLLKHLQNLKISSIFLTKDSKNPDSNKDEHNTYQNIVSDEHFDQTVLISTSVLDNGINIKDPSVKHIVINMLDRTEFIQMLGRIRIFDDLCIDLYIKNYSDKEISDFLYRDLYSLISRLQLETILLDKRIYFFEHLRQNPPSYRVYQNKNDYLYLTKKVKKHSKEKIKVKYNICSIFKLIDRISTFILILSAKNPKFYIDFSKLKELQPKRQKVIDFFTESKELLPKIYNSKISNDLYRKILYILNYNDDLKKILYEDHVIHILSHTFLSYIFIVKISNYIEKEIQYYQSSNIIDNFDVITSKLRSLIEELHRYQNIIYIDNTDYPSVKQQLLWIECDNFKKVTFLNKKNVVQLVDCDDVNKEIENILETLAISEQEFNEGKTRGELNKSNSSYVKQDHVSFTNMDLLKNKASEVKNINEQFQNIFKLFATKDGTETYDPRSLADTLNKQPFYSSDNKFMYKLIIVRGTKKDYQKTCCIFVKFPYSKVEENP